MNDKRGVKPWGLIILVTTLIVAILIGICIVSFQSHNYVSGKPKNAQQFLQKYDMKIKHDLYTDIDPKHNHIQAITLEPRTANGFYDNGGDISGNYHIKFLAYVNHQPNKQLKLEITFPDAEIGPFTFVKPNPYKKQNMSFDADCIDITYKDLAQKNLMQSWWNWNDDAYWNNFKNSTGRNQQPYWQIEKTFLYHQNNILTAYQQYLQTQYPGQTIANLQLAHYKDTFVTVMNEPTHYNVSYDYSHNGTDEEDSLDLVLTRTNLKDPSAPLKISLVGDSTTTVQTDAVPPTKAEINAFHEASAHWQ